MAIVMAMLFAAFAALVAATLLWQQQRWANDQSHRRDQVQAQALAMAGVHWARQVLYEDKRSSTIDHLGEPWALTLPPTPIENGSISGSIVDAQSRLNLNSLGRTDATSVAMAAALTRLFAAHGVPVELATTIADWTDVDDQTRAGGAEDRTYLAQEAPALAANAPLVRTAEVLSVRGADAAALARIRPYVTAIDESVPVNVNTAPADVLMALVEGLSAEEATAMVEARKQKPFASGDDFQARLPRAELRTSGTTLASASSYFEVTVEAHQADTTARARALLHRETAAWPTVVWQVVE